MNPSETRGAKPLSGQRHMPGEEGLWLFIFGDMLFFSAFFITYTYYRAQDVGLYDQSQENLSQTFGLINTLLLLTSSWLVALALRAVRQARPALSRGLVLGAGALGLGFVVSKGLEWSDKFAQGINIQTNEFYMFYFMFTGIHLIHVVIGLGVLTYLYLRIRKEADGPALVGTFEGGAAFWHLVDLLWVVLFALLYLMR